MAIAQTPRYKTRILAILSIILIIELIYLAIRIEGAYVLNLPDFAAFGWDFSVFWAASLLTLHGSASNAYDPSLTEPIVRVFQHIQHRPFPTPWVYPPTFLLAVRWLALLSYPVSLIIYSILSIAFAGYAWWKICKPVWPDWLLGITFPAFILSLIAGQNSLFTFGLAALALVWLEDKPWLSGICVGLLAIKPQLGILFPIALIAGRHWKAFIAAASTVTGFCLLSAIVLGIESYQSFITSLAWFSHFMATLNWPGGMPTWFGVARRIGFSQPQAYVIHILFALLAVIITTHLFTSRVRLGLRAAALPLATLICQPYLLAYDFTWLALPLTFMILDFKEYGWSYTDGIAMLSLWLITLLALLTITSYTMFAPLILTISLVLIYKRAMVTR